MNLIENHGQLKRIMLELVSTATQMDVWTMKDLTSTLYYGNNRNKPSNFLAAGSLYTILDFYTDLYAEKLYR